MVLLEDIEKNLPGGNNMGGLQQYLWYGYHKDVLTWPTAPNPNLENTLEENGKYTGNLEMKPGKRLFKMYITDDTGELKVPIVGEMDGQSFEFDLTIFHPGMQKKLLGFVNANKNENLVFIAPDSEGQKYILGDAQRPCTMVNGEGLTTGKATKDRKGAGLAFKYKANNVLAYEGTIPDSFPESSGSGSGI